MFLQESSHFWDEIKNATYLFDRNSKLVSVLKSSAINHSAVMAFYDKYLMPNTSTRRKFSSQLYGCKASFPAAETTPGDNNVVVVTHPSVFKRSCSMMPVGYFSTEA